MIAKYIGLSTLRNEEKHFTKPLLLMEKVKRPIRLGENSSVN